MMRKMRIHVIAMIDGNVKGYDFIADGSSHQLFPDGRLYLDLRGGTLDGKPVLDAAFLRAEASIRFLED
jgi:hypothetical protein